MKTIDKFQVTAPTRADLAGGTLDLWPLYCLVPNSRTVNIALDLNAVVQFEVVESDFCQVELKGPKDSYTFKPSKVDFKSETVPAGLRFPAFVVNQFLVSQESLPSYFIRIRFSSSVPQGSGLGGSSTLLVALGRGLCRVCSDYTEQGWQWRFLQWAKDTEGAFLKMPTGTQDYLAALFGGLHSYQFQLGKIVQTPYPSSVFESLNERMVIVFSGEQHHSGLSNWEVYKKAIDGNTEVLGGLNQIAAIAQSLNESLQKEVIAWPEVGKLLDEEWKVRRNTFQVNTPTLDRTLEAVRKMGTIGLKVCGAAQGGSLLVLAEPNHRPKLIEQLTKAGIQVLQARGTRSGVNIQDDTSDVD